MPIGKPYKGPYPFVGKVVKPANKDSYESRGKTYHDSVYRWSMIRSPLIRWPGTTKRSDSDGPRQRTRPGRGRPGTR